MVAIAKDENNQIFSIAWVIVGTEKKDTQRWFMRILQDDLQLGDGTQVTIISDMQKVWHFLFQYDSVDFFENLFSAAIDYICFFFARLG